jgi:hypothetical protein
MIPWMAENADFVRGVVRDAAGKEAEGKRPSQSSDFSFNNLGITGFFRPLAHPEEGDRAARVLLRHGQRWKPGVAHRR